MSQRAESFDPLIDRPPSRFVVGIDLGTTNSAVTYVDTEEQAWQIQVLLIPQMVSATESESLDTLPSFYFQPIQTERAVAKTTDAKTQPASFCVGRYARDETAKTSGRGISSAKSWLCHAAVDRTADLLPWHGADDVQRISPVAVSGEYLRHIRIVWDQQFPDFPLAEQDIVLTLPASFDEVARELTVSAAALAGLPRVVLIEEPQAAFYAWIHKHEDQQDDGNAGDSGWESHVEVGQKILICDIGGGTTDFTLIRVRKARDHTGNPNSTPTQTQTDSDGFSSQTSNVGHTNHRIQFHRVAVGQHLILGGDNLDLAIAKYLETKLSAEKKLEPYQWDVLVGNSRSVKEQLLSESSPETITVSLPSRGSKLIGGSLSTEVTRDEIRQLILNGFLPQVDLLEKPQRHASGFQEFGLPFASDAAITRYLGQFLTDHATAGLEMTEFEPTHAAHERIHARPDVVLFNGGFFASPILRQRLLQQISLWFQGSKSEAGLPAGGASPDWQPVVLDNDRLDLAVARGAAYYGMVRRDIGVRIAATLARSYYIGIGGDPSGDDPAGLKPPQAICVMPGSAEPGQIFSLTDRVFQLTLSQPVEFSIYVSSIRLADQPGQILDINPEQLTALPPIRTVLRASSRNEKRDVAVQLQIGLTEIGTIDLSCHEVESDRSWKLQFDIRSTTQTDIAVHQGSGETQGVVADQIWECCEQAIGQVFDKGASSDVVHAKNLVKQLTEIFGEDRNQWPMSLLRRIWQSLMDREAGRRKSAQHESRWLNLLGFALRPGYGIALDDWRVTETWRNLNGKLAHSTASVRNESLILWRRLAGGLSRGQQSALAEPWLASLRGFAKQLSGKTVKGNLAIPRPEDLVEVWRLLGSLEWLAAERKFEIGSLIVSLKDKPKLKNSRAAMIWTLGRLGQRVPLYGPLNTVLHPDQVSPWLLALIKQRESGAVEHLAVVQMARLTGDRYRDIDDPMRQQIVEWLKLQSAASHLVKLVHEGGTFDSEEQFRVFGESLPPGLRLE